MYRVIEENDKQLSFKLLDQILRETAINLSSAKMNSQEERQILWTTLANLKMWFANWEKGCLELGFAKKDASGATIFPKEQLHNILNIDETCLPLGGSSGA